MRRYYFIIFTLLSALSGYSQINILDKSLSIDFADVDGIKLLDSVNVNSIDKLIVYDFSENIEVLNNKKLSNISTLVIKDSPNLDLKKLIKVLHQQYSIQNLVIDGELLSGIPSNIRKLNTLKSLTISDNSGVNLEKLVNHIKKIENLEELSLPINEISNLPNNIGDLAQIKTLDLRNNYLTDLPSDISSMDSLEALNLEENIIIDPVNALSKIKGLKIKYLSFDGEGISKEEMKKLKEVFPNTNIQAIVEDDSVKTEIAKNNEVTDTVSSKRKMGSFMTKDQKIKAYSTAYIYYPFIYRDIRLEQTFDSTSFDDRYSSFDYINVRPRNLQFQRWDFLIGNYNIAKRNRWKYYGYFILKPYKNRKTKSISLSFANQYNRRPQSLYYSNPEIRAFSGYHWIYKGSMSKKELKKFLKKKAWAGIRIFYEKENGLFRMELKSDSCFTSLAVLPVKYDSDKEESVKKYLRVYKNYERALKRRKSNFERNLRRNKNKYLKEQKKVKRNIWKRFQRDFMSYEERLLTRDEWLKYYEKVIADEKEAISNADPTISNIQRGLELNGINLCKMNVDYYNKTYRVSGDFYYKDSNLLHIVNYVIVDVKNNEYSLSVSQDIYARNFNRIKIDKLESQVFLNRPYTIIVELSNGNIGIVKDYSFHQANEKALIQVDIIDKTFSSVGQIYNLIGI